MGTFFISDTHLGDAPRLRVDKRPFKSIGEMDRAIVERWNETVGTGDEVWHLGDFAYRANPERVGELLSRLNGRKHLITGNNDGPATLRAPGWATVAAYADIEMDGTRLILCHYPFRTWDGMYKGVYNVHGHSHGQLAAMTRQVDVGVDVWDFKPIGLRAIRAARARRKR